MPGRIVKIAVAVAALVTGLAAPARAATAGTALGGPRPSHPALIPALQNTKSFGRWLPSVAPGARLIPQEAASGSWRVQPSQNPVMPNGSLTAVSCTGTACTAVGGYENQSGTGLTLAERRTGGSWAIQATPNPAGAVWSGLTGVSCATAADCAAVGWSVTTAGREVSLAQRWDGRRWTVTPVPSPAGAGDTGLFGVSCTTPRACTAVGEYVTAGGAARPLAARWDGTRWAIQPVPVPPASTGSELGGVSCGPAGTCMAAGATATASTQLTLAERWDGTSWHVTATPSPAGAQGSGFTAISCGPAPSCVAVGSYGAPSADGSPAALAETWNGTSWRVQVVPVPPPGGQSLPASAFESVSCASKTACTAAGTYSAGAGLAANLAESWNGSQWTIQRPPNPVGNIGSGLSGVSCTAKGGCEAAGTYYVQSPLVFVGGLPIPGMALAESWNGTRWTIGAARDRAGADEYGELNAISCAPKTPRACAAVGDYLTSAGLFAPLAERWTGSRWVIAPVPNPSAKDESFLDGVSCPSPTACTAVGSTVQVTGTFGAVALAERWNGTRWRTEPTPLPAHALGDQLSAVSCPTATDCVAVGDYLKGKAPLAEQWNGTRWRVLTVPVPAGTGASALSAISCTGPRACVAAGHADDDLGNQRALIEAWNGASWRIHAVASPKGTVLSGVWCTAPGACTAVGLIATDVPGPKGGPGQVEDAPFAVRLSGTRWTRQAVPDPAAGGWLNGVSCSGPRACTAVGGANTSNGATVLLAQTWSGNRWTFAPAANPAPAFDSVLNGVTCATPRACAAVGSYLALTNVNVTLAMTAG